MLWVYFEKAFLVLYASGLHPTRENVVSGDVM